MDCRAPLAVNKIATAPASANFVPLSVRLMDIVHKVHIVIYQIASYLHLERYISNTITRSKLIKSTIYDTTSNYYIHLRASDIQCFKC